MNVYSGKCKLCQCGLPTGIYDAKGELLETGDIVLIYTAEENVGVTYLPENLTVVVQNQFQSYSDGSHVPNDGPQKPFVMGIANVDIANSDWFAIRVKSWKDVVNGEHWRAYGFNFRNDDVTGRHWSDCATHNMPAMPNGECDCGANAPTGKD